ncbi:MAG: hydroxymethylglutaryl-CoA lyase [Marinovum sp.]|nr:hydroxymethylglutaryl-CoA lyase [Marinovum sp.]MDG1018794.1 hydroxymethylglutaryl-CoA lyase [Paracoccaceae bacterium]
MPQNIDVLVSEVGPRDGLQSIKRTMPTKAKLDWIQALAAAGLQEIEVGSFVSPRLLPQMADCDELVKESNKIKNLTVLALVPNLKGAERAIAAGARKLTMPPSASRTHGLNNIGKTPEEAIDEVERVCALRDTLPVKQRPEVEVGISTAFGCTLEGPVSEDWVIEMAGLLAKAGADSIGLSDTSGYANPNQIKRMFRRLRNEIGPEKMAGAHLHNTRGQGLANVVAALEEEVTTFDSSLGGLGGCPYAPGATGNIVTEDLVFMLEAMGLRTGIDIEALIAAREVLLHGLPEEMIYGSLPEVGLPKGFTYAKARGPM